LQSAPPGKTDLRGVICKAFDGPGALVADDLPDPVPGSGEVLVSIRAAGVNFTDLLAVEGRSQLKRKLPIIPGTEAAGVIASLGPDARGLKVGDRVLATCIEGAFAERKCFRRDEVFPIPPEMDFATAAVFFIASMTSYYALVRRAKLKPGENLLVLGAGSGVGLAAVEIGKALGARVVAAASSDDKMQLALARGADGAVKYPREPLDLENQKQFSRELRTAAGTSGTSHGPDIGQLSTLGGSGGYDVVYDAVGGTYSEPALRALGWEGRFLAIGFAAGMPSVTLGPALFKNANIMGIEPAADEYRLPGRNAPMMEKLFGWYREGRLKPRITERYPLERAGDALRELKERRAKGRIVLFTGDTVQG
jgi:NADPH2:quinone reductase